MNILWFSWKDISHPQAGGAETVSHELRQRLVKNGHTVKLITSAYPNSGAVKTENGVEIHYVGGRYSIYLKAWLLYRKNLRGWDEVTIDEMNTIPFLAAAYTSSKKRILLSYQLARKVWFYQMPFPLSLFGYYILEPILLRIASALYGLCVTESKSSRVDMQQHGFKNVKVFDVGMSMTPLKKITGKSDKNLVLSLGSVRPMKRTLDAVKAFEFARDINPDLYMIVAGDADSHYGRRVASYVSKSKHKKAIKILGRIPAKDRLKYMRSAGVILVTSIKEGWGLIVTEANSQGTPAVVYDVDGLRDSVRHNETGIITQDGNPYLMGQSTSDLLSNAVLYDSIRKHAWQLSSHYTFDQSYISFTKATGITNEK